MHEIQAPIVDVPDTPKECPVELLQEDSLVNPQQERTALGKKRKSEFITQGTALYLFAGPKRHSSIGTMLRNRGWTVTEVDILQGGKSHDLTLETVQNKLITRIEHGEFDALLTSPPCDTFSRVKFSNPWGPQPTRTSKHPRGLPTCGWKDRKRNQLANALTDFNFRAIKVQLAHSHTMVILEFPEDLGVITRGAWTGVRPASIFQWPDFQEVIGSKGVVTGGIRQSDFGTEYVKPTRLILRFHGDWSLPELFPGPPVFNEIGLYLGPIPATKGLRTLAKRSKWEPFRTTNTAAWPVRLCERLTELLCEGFAAAKRAPNDCLDVGSFSGTALETRSTKIKEFPIYWPPWKDYWIGGSGPPRKTRSLGKVADFHDGCGLTSPGRWDRLCRVYPSGQKWEELRSELLGVLKKDLDAAGVLKQIAGLACGKEIFNFQWVNDCRQVMHRWLIRHSSSYAGGQDPVQAPGQPFFLDLIGALLREVKDADAELFQELHKGVTLGVIHPLPHNPALYELQEKWRLHEDVFLQAKLEKANYASVKDHVEAVAKQFEEEQALGWMESLTDSEFEKRYGDNRAVSALAVLVEPDKIRILHDATHDTRVNHRIKVRDRQRMPTVREMHYLLDAQRAAGKIAIAILGDSSKAHRRILINPEEHGLLGCRIRPGEVWINKVGTFGLSSASYWWSRVAGAVHRLMYAVLGGDLSLDLLLFADDTAFIAETAQERWSILLGITILLAWGLPFKWSKFRGGYEVGWVGFGVCFKSYAIGLTESRAAWVITWCEKLIKAGRVEVTEMRSGIGRLSYAAQALVYEKAFLGVLYLWTAAIVRGNVRVVTIPWAVRFVLAWIKQRMQAQGTEGTVGRLQPAPYYQPGVVDWFRTDAKAENGRAFIGGWELDSKGTTERARWFSFEIMKEDAPWVFAKSGDPQRVIAALELLATMTAIVLFDPNRTRGGRTGCSLTGSTDNRGNSYIVAKLASTKWPIAVLLIELSEQLRARKSMLELTWRRREDNKEADALTNQEFAGFDPACRVGTSYKDIRWLVLDSVMDLSAQLYDEIQQQKRTRLEGPGIHPKRRGKQAMKWRDPW